ncbi:MAG: hypothetical protein K0S07_813 [Chlamydiales bacterium]|nr:hypothetical protein [Chlamydiales bacterium]
MVQSLSNDRSLIGEGLLNIANVLKKESQSGLHWYKESGMHSIGDSSCRSGFNLKHSSRYLHIFFQHCLIKPVVNSSEWVFRRILARPLSLCCQLLANSAKIVHWVVRNCLPFSSFLSCPKKPAVEARGSQNQAEVEEADPLASKNEPQAELPEPGGTKAINDLPPELKLSIANLLSKNELKAMNLVNQEWHSIAMRVAMRSCLEEGRKKEELSRIAGEPVDMSNISLFFHICSRRPTTFKCSKQLFAEAFAEMRRDLDRFFPVFSVPVNEIKSIVDRFVNIRQRISFIKAYREELYQFAGEAVNLHNFDLFLSLYMKYYLYNRRFIQALGGLFAIARLPVLAIKAKFPLKVDPEEMSAPVMRAHFGSLQDREVIAVRYLIRPETPGGSPQTVAALIEGDEMSSDYVLGRQFFVKGMTQVERQASRYI